MWLKELKIAIIEKDIKKFTKLMNLVPQLTKPDELDEAICLINEAKTIIIDLKQSTKESMNQIKKNIDFLEVMEDIPTNKLDVIS